MIIINKLWNTYMYSYMQLTISYESRIDWVTWVRRELFRGMPKPITCFLLHLTFIRMGIMNFKIYTPPPDFSQMLQTYIWIKLTLWFLRRSWKCLKFNTQCITFSYRNRSKVTWGTNKNIHRPYILLVPLVKDSKNGIYVLQYCLVYCMQGIFALVLFWPLSPS